MPINISRVATTSTRTVSRVATTPRAIVVALHLVCAIVLVVVLSHVTWRRRFIPEQRQITSIMIYTISTTDAQVFIFSLVNRDVLKD